MGTLREGLVNAINELNKLLLETSDPGERKEIRNLRRIYVTLIEEVVRITISRRTNAFREAAESLEEARKAAVAAKRDIKKIADAIDKAASAAAAVNKVVKFGIGVLA